MAISGAWRELQGNPQPFAASTIWGQGINPVHSRYGKGDRNVIPNVNPSESHIPENMIGDMPASAYGYCEEDGSDYYYGYGTEDGTADRPGLGEPSSGIRAQTTPGYPSPGRRADGMPGGAGIRSRMHGGRLSWRSKLRFRAPVYEGTLDKSTQEVLDSAPPPVSQMLIQTSAVQRDKTRAGSQRGSASASDYRAPIKSRIIGMRIPQQVGGERHEDMRPRTQTAHNRRPFFTRGSGAPDPEQMRVNAAYESQPLQRTPPTNPYPGESVQSAEILGYGGYSTEDPLW